MIKLTLKAATQEELGQLIADLHGTFNGEGKQSGNTVISTMGAEKKPRAPRKPKAEEKVEGVDDGDVKEEIVETGAKETAGVKAKTVETPEAKAGGFDYEVLKAKVLSFSKDPANRSTLLGILKKFGVDHATKLDAKDWKAAYDAIVEAEQASSDLA